MNRLWKWLKKNKTWDWLLGILISLTIILMILTLINPTTQTPNIPTVSCNCTQLRATHTTNIQNLHDRNEEILTELIIAREQIKVWDSINMNDFVEEER